MKAKNPQKILTLELPEKILTLLRQPADDIVCALRIAAAVHWFERGVLPQEKALEIAGLTREEFLAAQAIAQQQEEEAP